MLPLSGPKGLTSHGWTSRPVMGLPMSVTVCVGLRPMIVFCCFSYSVSAVNCRGLSGAPSRGVIKLHLFGVVLG
jgi:hypothetical protein